MAQRAGSLPLMGETYVKFLAPSFHWVCPSCCSLLRSEIVDERFPPLSPLSVCFKWWLSLKRHDFGLALCHRGESCYLQHQHSYGHWVCPSGSISNQLPTNNLAKGSKDGPSAWVSAVHVGYLGEAPGLNLSLPWPLWPSERWISSQKITVSLT